LQNLPDGICPCCGQAVDPLKLFIFSDGNIASYNGDAVHLSNMQTTLARTLARAWPNAVPLHGLIHEMYGKNEIPSAKETVRVYVNQLRGRLRPLDIEILCEKESGYRLSLPHQVSIARVSVQRRKIAA
jgi:DNA-binding response OmpR family regulator